MQELISLLKIPSVSTLPEYLPHMEKARQFLVQLFKSLGFSTQILPAQKHPAVFAQLKTSDQKPTVLIYGHYDVQPPDPLDQWISPPFKPTVRSGKLYARGSTDNKGQFMIHVMAVKRLSNQFPVNFKFIIEGEEEIGSPSVEQLARKYQRLLAADYLVVSDSEMPRPGQPAIDTSLRGLVYTQVTVTTAGQDLHSGQFGGVAENPAIVLARIITQLKNLANRVLIPGFYRSVAPPLPSAVLATTTAQIKKEGQLFTLGGGEREYSLNQRRWSRPTLDVNGLTSGYQGPGPKTIIPALASAKISMRLVPNQDPDKIFKLFDKYVKKLVAGGVKVKVENLTGCLPYKAPTNHPVFNLMKKSLKQAFGKPVVYTGVGGSIGFVPVLAGTLGVPCLLVGFGLPDENLHAPNEHFSLENYQKGIATMVDFYSRLPV